MNFLVTGSAEFPASRGCERLLEADHLKRGYDVLDPLFTPESNRHSLEEIRQFGAVCRCYDED